MMKNKELRCLHITHDDGDALGCTLVVDFLKKYKSDTIYCDVNRASDALLEVFETTTKDYYDFILITDIRVSEEVCSMLDRMRISRSRTEIPLRLLLVDHHESAKNLIGMYEWVKVEVRDEITSVLTPRSAAEILLSELQKEVLLVDNSGHDITTEFHQLISDISRYDTYEWKKHPSELMNEDTTSIIINNHGIVNAEEIIRTNLINFGVAFTETELNERSIYKSREMAAIDYALNNYVEADFLEYKIALLISNNDTHTNAQCEAIYNNRYDLDFVMILFPHNLKVSMRSCLKDLNLARIAHRLYGGGGHRQAAGATVDSEVMLKWLHYYYEKSNQKYTEPTREVRVEG